MKLRQLRKQKRNKPKDKSYRQYLRHTARHFKPGTIIETCGCDVARVVSVSADGDDLVYESLTRGGKGSCSIYNCGPIRLSQVAIERRLELYKEGGQAALSRRYYVEDCKLSPEEADKLIKEWS
jgi:hypothetical protein